MSGKKRGLEGGDGTESRPAKEAREEKVEEEVEKVMGEEEEHENELSPNLVSWMESKELEEFTSKLVAIEQNCSREVGKIQKKAEEAKREIYVARDRVIEEKKIWGEILCSCDFVAQILSSKGIEILKEHLEKFRVEDHLDERGSFCITMSFDAGAAQYFSPQVLTRKVVYTEEGDEDTEASIVTKIEFVDPKMHSDLTFLDLFRVKKNLSTDERESLLRSLAEEDKALFSEDQIDSWMRTYDPIFKLLRGVIYPRPNPTWGVFLSDSSDEDEEDDFEEDDDEEEETNSDKNPPAKPN